MSYAADPGPAKSHARSAMSDSTLTTISRASTGVADDADGNGVDDSTAIFRTSRPRPPNGTTMSTPLLKYLTTTELANALQISERIVVNMRENGTGPKFERVGRSIRYPPWAIQEWIDQNKQNTRATHKRTRRD